jgi:hypothetical protein
MDRAELIEEFSRLWGIGYEIAKLHSLGEEPGWFWPDEEMGMKIVEDGLQLFDRENDPYDDSVHIASVTVPWDEVDDYVTTILVLKQKAEATKKQRAKEQHDWKLKQFEALKRELGR